MPRAVDRLPLPISNDPNQSLEYHIRYGLQQGLDMWMVILDAIREHAEALVKEVIEKIIGFALDPQGTIEDALGELLAWAVNVPGLQQLVLALTGAAGGLTELEAWASNLWQQVLTAINTHAGIDLSSWDAFLASLNDGKGIDLPVVPQLVAALDGIPWESGDPGAILRQILEAGAAAVKDILTALLFGRAAEGFPSDFPVAFPATGILGDGGKLDDLQAIVNGITRQQNQQWQAVLMGLGLAGQSVTPENPAIVDLLGRIAAQENQAVGNTWTEGFDRASIGPLWTPVAGSTTIRNDRGDGYVIGNTSSIGALVYNDETFDTPQHYAQVRIREAAVGKGALCIMAAPDLSQYVCVRYVRGLIFDNHVQIATGTGTGSGNYVIRADYGIPRDWRRNDVMGIGYDPESLTYVAYLNDEPVCVWADSNAEIAAAGGKSQALIFNCDGGGFSGPGMDNVAAYDWTSS